MNIKKVITGIFMLVLFISCKTNREVNKSSSRMDSTAASSKEIAKGTQIYQQQQNNRLDNSFANGQNKYQRQTISLQLAPDTTGRNKGNVTGLLPSALEQRLMGITIINEEGMQDIQTGKTTQEQTGWINAQKDTLNSAEKKSAVVNKVEAAKHTTATHKVGSSAWLLVLLLIVVIVLWIWKGNPIALLIGWIKKKRKEDTQATPAD